MPVALLPLLAPVVLVLAAIVSHRDRSARHARAVLASRAATVIGLVVAGITVGLAAAYAPLVSPLLVHDGLGFSIRIDGLSAVMFALVAILGAAVVAFSRRYLDGDPRQGAFVGDLALTIACVMVLVLSGNLVQLFVGWLATSLALHRLLLFYRDRPGARVAARKKYLVARLGDASLAIAIVLVVRQLGSGDLEQVMSGVTKLAASGPLPLGLHVAASLLSLTAVLKAAQFPFHGWLVEMQETPTPVSALLHAGILNGGTFLVVRLAALLQLSSLALAVLVVVGGFTATFASVVMVTDSRVKATLAWSSAAHMGFMLLLCGIGAYPVAVAHLVAHSFYKAHAFLAAGSAVEVARAARVPAMTEASSPGRVLLACVVTAAMVWTTATITGVSVSASTVNVVLAVVMTIALFHLMARGVSARIAGRTAMYVAATALAFYALEHVGAAVLARSVPKALARGPVVVGLVALVVAGFALVTALQVRGPRHARSRRWGAAYVHARNGLYANACFDLLVDAHRAATSARAGAARLAPTHPSERPPIATAAVEAALARAAEVVAPVWPLADFVAVNPFMGIADRPIADAARRVARTAGARTTMPRQFYLDAISTGRVRGAHVSMALAEARADGATGLPSDAAAFTAMLAEDAPPPPRPLPTVSEVATTVTGRAWNRLVVDRIGAWAAAYFDEGQASWRSPWQALGPYEAFHTEASIDRTPEIFGARGFRAIIARYPSDAAAAAARAITRLGVPEAALDPYLERLVGTIGGWAAYARHIGWKRTLAGARDTTLTEVLVIRLVWEAALLESLASAGAEDAWQAARGELVAAAADDAAPVVDLVLHAAYEKAWQERLFDELRARRSAPVQRSADRAAVQAVFCIDVRSEVFRRALETTSPRTETFGFAGFFGFPVEHVPLGLDRGVAQCPVLLAPKAVVVDRAGASAHDSARAAAARVIARRVRNAWRSFKSSAVACFGFVGPVGLAYLPKLVADSLGWSRPVPHPSRDGVPAGTHLGLDLSTHARDDRQVGLSAHDRLAMAEGLLRGTTLTRHFARLVFLVGHQSTTVNNPHAAGLDCGACGGHSGEVNARVAAMVLNEPAVRAGLACRGITIPDDTVFVGCVHDTTTDVVSLCDRHLVPASHHDALRDAEAHLHAAGAITRRERAGLLGEDAAASGIDGRIMRRSRDWAQVRPEWGLAGCASFIVAPRERTRGLDLGGRAFLHSYDWREDERDGFAALETILTAPVVVGSWISLQYFASTVDNAIYGCGNKVLHNVVGTIGVLEGNGGDLRVGLPWQSVHDGERLAHEPLRLSVLIEAPVEAMSAILSRHPAVRSLFDNGWLHLFALDEAGVVGQRYAGRLGWQRVAPPPAALAA